MFECKLSTFWDSSCIQFDTDFPSYVLVPSSTLPKTVLPCVNVPFSVSRGTHSGTRTLTVHHRFLISLFPREPRYKTTTSCCFSFVLLQMNLDFFFSSFVVLFLLITEFGRITLCELFCGFPAARGAAAARWTSTVTPAEPAKQPNDFSMPCVSSACKAALPCACWPRSTKPTTSIMCSPDTCQTGR